MLNLKVLRTKLPLMSLLPGDWAFCFLINNVSIDKFYIDNELSWQLNRLIDLALQEVYNYTTDDFDLFIDDKIKNVGKILPLTMDE